MAFAGLPAAEYVVSPTGKDTNPGTKQKPFATIQKAADTVKPGDTVRILEGHYRETVELKTSGTADKPIQFVADGKVVIDGSDPVKGPWERHKENIWKTSVDGPQIQQLFVNGVMQNEARWPNATFEKRWDRGNFGWRRNAKARRGFRGW